MAEGGPEETLAGVDDHQEFTFAGSYGENGFLEDYTAVVPGEHLGNVVLVTRNAAGQAHHIVANYRPRNTLLLLSRLLGENGFEVIETNPVLPILLDYVSNPQGTHAPDSWRARMWKRVLAKNEGLRYHFGFDLGQWLQAHGYADTLTVFAAAR